MTLSWRQMRAVLCLYPPVLPVSVTHRGTTFCVFLLSLEQEIVLPTDRNGEGMASLNVHVEQSLRTDPLVWLITERPDGRPYIVPVWFFWDGQTFLIFSEPNTQKLRQNLLVTLALDGAGNFGYDVVVFEGTAELLNDLSQRLTEKAA